jgi:hypothetical protein
VNYKVKCSVCGHEDIDAVYNDNATYSVYYHDIDDSISIGELKYIDPDGGTRDGFFCNYCGDYVYRLERGEVFESGVSWCEVMMPLSDGFSLVVSPTPKGVDYVRIVDQYGQEVVYWDVLEWAEDPHSVMAAIFGAMLSPGSIKERIGGKAT